MIFRCRYADDMPAIAAITLAFIDTSAVLLDAATLATLRATLRFSLLMPAPPCYYDAIIFFAIAFVFYMRCHTLLLILLLLIIHTFFAR